MKPLALVSFFLLCFNAYATDTWRSQVQTQMLDKIAIQLTQNFAAEVISPNQTILSSELNAKIEHIAVRPGDAVKSGQLLIALDCRDTQSQLAKLEAQYAQTQASLNLAQLQLTRLTDLIERQLTSTNTFDEAQTQVTQLNAALQAITIDKKLASRQIERCRLTAPFDGAILQQRVGVGQWVAVGQSLIELVQTTHAEIEVQVPHSWLNQSNQAWLASLTAQGKQYHDLVLLRQAASLDPRSRSIKLWFAAPPDLPIGLAGELSLTQAQRYLPANVIVKRNNQLGVFVVKADQLLFNVLPQAEEGRPYPIPPDWSAEMEIVTSGQNRLNHSTSHSAPK